MMDYYSNYAAPPREAAIIEVHNILKQKYNQRYYNKILEITTKIILDMPSLGSYTGWYVGFRNDAIQNIIIQFEKYKMSLKNKFFGIIRIKIIFHRLKLRIAEKIYTPGNIGYLIAKKDFDSKLNNQI
jgi:hypothetical protein